MLYQLRNGKTIELSVEQFLNMSSNELEALEGVNWSNEVNDPFAISVLHYGPANDDVEFDDYNYTESIDDLTSLDKNEKLFDSDYIDKDNLEE